MAGTVPDLVAVVHPHMAHLDRQEIFQRGLPDMPLEHVRPYLERRSPAPAVLHHVHARRGRGREIELEIVIAQETAPIGRRRLDDFLQSPALGDPPQRRRQPALVVRVRLDHRDFALPGMISHLGDLHDGLCLPARDRVGRHKPLDRVLRRAPGHRRAHDEPSVRVLAPPVDQLQVAAGHRRYAHALFLDLGRDHQLPPRSERRDHVLPVRAPDAGTIGLPRENARLAVEGIGPPEKRAREKLQVEAHAPHPGFRQRPVEIDDDPERSSGRDHPHGIAEAQVGIADRVEALPVPRGIRILHAHADFLRLSVHRAGAGLGHRLPLSRSRVKAQVAVGGDAAAVLDDTHTALMPFRIVIVGEHDIEPWHLEIFELVERQGWLGCSSRARTGEDQAGKQPRDSPAETARKSR